MTPVAAGELKAALNRCSHPRTSGLRRSCREQMIGETELVRRRINLLYRSLTSARTSKRSKSQCRDLLF